MLDRILNSAIKAAKQAILTGFAAWGGLASGLVATILPDTAPIDSWEKILLAALVGLLSGALNGLKRFVQYRPQ